jgi:hypothetical protein
LFHAPECFEFSLSHSLNKVLGIVLKFVSWERNRWRSTRYNLTVDTKYVREHSTLYA